MFCIKWRVLVFKEALFNTIESWIVWSTFIFTICPVFVSKIFFSTQTLFTEGKVIDWCGQAFEDALNLQTLDKNTKKVERSQQNTNSNPFHLFSKKNLFLFGEWIECQTNLHLNHNLQQSFYIHRNKLQHASFTATICCICKHFSRTSHLDAQHSNTSETCFEC